MVAVTVALIGFFALIMMRVTAPQMTPLFTDLSFEDSSAIVKDLERQGIPFELKSDNAIVLVPKDKVARLRMRLAEGGLPKGGGIGYEIFDKSDALGATSFVQNINHLRALEGELARTIRAIDRVQAARVHLVLPERALFSRDKAEASASPPAEPSDAISGNATSNWNSRSNALAFFVSRGSVEIVCAGGGCWSIPRLNVSGCG